jgi:hypothetical protein
MVGSGSDENEKQDKNFRRKVRKCPMLGEKGKIFRSMKIFAQSHDKRIAGIVLKLRLDDEN